MRALISTFLILLFAGGQAFAGICGSMCIHGKGSNGNHSQIGSQSSDHDCCDTAEKEDSSKQGHDCSLGHCMVSVSSFKAPLMSVEIQTEKKLLDSVHATEIAGQFRLASLSSKALSLDRSDPNELTPPVPLYIYYQKLLLP